MRPVAALANSLWCASALPSWLRFRHALKQPGGTQWQLLRLMLGQNAACAYGREHGFLEIKSYEDFARRVPIIDYDEIEPWIVRIKSGEKRVLTAESVSHLIPTSGSSGGRKLIPFTAGLQRQFNQAIEPWIADLMTRERGVMAGPAYWSITPVLQSADAETSSVPIGFIDDAEYLGGVKSWLAGRTIVAPKDAHRLVDVEEFKFTTLSCLLRERELRLISVWHPSFLTLLLDALPTFWKKLLADVRTHHKHRASELERADPKQPDTLWPWLRVISCWGDGSAATAIADVRRRFPRALVQPKGLLATEAFISIPFERAQPLAVRSHFLEFIDENGRIRLAHELREHETYEAVVTTAGGLWRYRLGDLVQVTRFVAATPSVRFVGRSGNVSDLCGEKLSEAFATRAVEETLALWGVAPRFVLLAPDHDPEGCRYTLYVEGTPLPEVAKTLDAALCKNPNYSYCRNLGQLLPVRIFRISQQGYETFAKRQITQGCRLGNIKPTFFSREKGWSKLFSGAFVQAHANSAAHTAAGAP
jgi:hypothetical protein